MTFGTGTRLDIFGNLKHLIDQQKIQILDKPELLRQLRSLEEHKTVRGNLDVRPANDGKDDLAVAVALAVFQLSNIDVQPMPPPSFFRVARPWDGRLPQSRSSLGLIPGACGLAAVCVE